MRCHPPAASLLSEPVSDRRAALSEIDVIKRAAPQHVTPIVWAGQREVQLLASQPRLLLLFKKTTRICLAVGLDTWPREPLNQRIAERHQLRWDICLVPGP